MSHSSGSSCGGGAGGVGGGGGSPDFDLSDEILAVIPADPYEQLDLARKLTSMAIASRVSKLEAEMTRTKTKLCEKERIVFDLEEKLSRLQRAGEEAESRLKLALDENAKLAKERDMLAMTTKKLGRDLAKLETFKRQLMQSLNDENVAPVETVENGTCDQMIPKAYPENVATDGGSNGYSGQHSFSGSTDTGNTIDDVSKNSGNRYTMTTYITPRLTPTGTPKNISSAVSPRGYSAFSSPKQISGATSPTKQPYDTRSSLSSWYPSSQQSSAANSPPHGRSLPGRTPRVDGKEFFRQARSRLSYEQFSAFLANIKELNAQKQTREDTLRNAEEIFGTENRDLYISFQGLLNRSVR